MTKDQRALIQKYELQREVACNVRNLGLLAIVFSPFLIDERASVILLSVAFVVVSIALAWSYAAGVNIRILEKESRNSW
jgi:hypothetical protein